jgi:ABC-type branched-subunit amino acid transport system ATPase component
MLEAINIKKSFNGLNVLKDISFSISQGSITSLFGENGSGKTTISNILSGFVTPDFGRIVFNDKDITRMNPVSISNIGIGRVWQTPRIFRNLSVLENLMLAARNHPGEKSFNYFFRIKEIFNVENAVRNKAMYIAHQINLSPKINETAGSFSFGEQKLLSIGMLLLNESELLILDEPFTGINGKMVDYISEVLLNLRNIGKTILIIEHNRTKAEKISDKILNLVDGKIIQNGITF